MKKSRIALFLIITLSILLRFINVPSIPPSLSWDEVSLGYNAYSILKTGRDEHGKFLPLSSFEAYGDYKPPGYIYADVLFVALFGLTEFAVRVPSLLAGVISVFVTYLLVKELFRKSSEKYREIVALLSSFLLSVSPWHLNITRAAYEANLAHTLSLIGILFFLKSIHGKPKLLILSGVFFVMSLYTFNSSRIFVPLLVLFLTFFNYEKLLKHMKWVAIAGLVSSVLLVPLMPHLLSKEGKLRFNEVNIFSDSKPVETANRRIEATGNAWWVKIIQNRRVQFGVEVARHYFDNLSPNYLFINGDGNPKFSIRDVGQLYIVEIPFLILGIYFLIKRKEGDPKLLITWLVLAIVPASIARETPHALRTLNTLPIWQIFIASGLVYGFFVEVNDRLVVKKKVLFIIFSIIFLLNALYYVHTYHTSYSKEYASEWQYGYREAIAYAETIKYKYDLVYITDKIGRPYMYTLFYTKYNPFTFQNTVNRTSDPYGFFTVHSFDKYIFDPALTDTSKHILYIDVTDKTFSNVIHTVFLPNGNPVLVLHE